MTGAPARDDGPSRRADAARYRILARALPVQRHDALGLLSALRMGLAVLRRRLAGDPLDLDAVRAKFADVEVHAGDLVQGVAALRTLDPACATRVPADDALVQCVGWVSAAAGLRGIRVAAVPGDGPAEVAQPQFHQALLGVLMHALDSASAPGTIEVALSGDGFRVTRRADPGATPTEVELPPALRLDDAGLIDSLVTDLGGRLLRDGDSDWVVQGLAGPVPDG